MATEPGALGQAWEPAFMCASMGADAKRGAQAGLWGATAPILILMSLLLTFLGLTPVSSGNHCAHLCALKALYQSLPLAVA